VTSAAAASPVAGRDEARRARRFVALDAWRAAAALAVVYGHLTAGRLGAGERHLAFYLAVDFFFVLSGFVLAHRYWAELTEGGPFRPVIVARLARLYPAHACVLLALLLAFGVEAIPAIRAGVPVLAAWGDAIPPFPGGGGLYTFVLNALLLQSVGFTPKGMSWNVPSWSISVEFFGSLALLLLIARWRWRGIRAALAAIAVAGYGVVFAAKGQLDAIFDALLQVVNLGLLRCIAGIALGMLCLLAFRRYLAQWSEGTLVTTALELAAIGAVLAVMIRPDYHSARDGFYPLAAAMVIVVFALEAGLIGRLLRLSPFAYLGGLSYSIYLVHWPLLFIMIEQYRLPTPLYLTAVFGCAVLLHHAVEVPARRALVRRAAQLVVATRR